LLKAISEASLAEKKKENTDNTAITIKVGTDKKASID